MDLNPQQEAFLSYYLNPKSETWGNAYQSALKAGYTKEYSESITAKKLTWLAEYVGDNKLLGKALENLEKFLDTEDKDMQMIKWKATETTLKGLGKGKFSERKELTGADGKDLQISIVKYEDSSTSQV